MSLLPMRGRRELSASGFDERLERTAIDEGDVEGMSDRDGAFVSTVGRRQLESGNKYHMDHLKNVLDKSVWRLCFFLFH